jgi:hypothetical protein
MAQSAITLTAEVPDADAAAPVRRLPVVTIGVAVGLLLAVLWSATLVDDQIGENVANNLLGHDALTGGVSSGLSGGIFAFVAGLAGTFTACNIAAFSAVGPMLGAGTSAASRARQALPRLGWLALGTLATAAVYGAIGAILGNRLPQLNTSTVGNHVPVRLVQSAIVFTVIGLAFLWLGLAAAHVLPDPLKHLEARWSGARLLVMGILVGGFLIGRPYPLFFNLFEEAARTHNPLYGAGTFMMTALGNIVVMAIVFVLLAVALGNRYQRWLTARAGRMATVSAVALIIGGAFLIFYWGVRLPAGFGYGWFPVMPWN